MDPDLPIPTPADRPASAAIDGALLRLLAEIGFVATACGLWRHAEDIFLGIRAVRPWNEFPVISHALARLSVGDDAYAVDLITQHALKINPDSALAQSYLGFALKRLGKKEEGDKWLQAVLDGNQDSTAVEIARTVLSESFKS